MGRLSSRNYLLLLPHSRARRAIGELRSDGKAKWTGSSVASGPFDHLGPPGRLRFRSSTSACLRRSRRSTRQRGSSTLRHTRGGTRCSRQCRRPGSERRFRRSVLERTQTTASPLRARQRPSRPQRRQPTHASGLSSACLSSSSWSVWCDQRVSSARALLTGRLAGHYSRSTRYGGCDN